MLSIITFSSGINLILSNQIFETIVLWANDDRLFQLNN